MLVETQWYPLGIELLKSTAEVKTNVVHLYHSMRPHVIIIALRSVRQVVRVSGLVAVVVFREVVEIIQSLLSLT